MAVFVNCATRFQPFVFSFLILFVSCVMPAWCADVVTSDYNVQQPGQDQEGVERSASDSRQERLLYMLDEIEQKSVRVDELVQIKQGAVQSEKSSLEVRILGYQIEIMRLYDQVAELVATMRMQGESIGRFESRLKNGMLPIGPYIRNAILERSAETIPDGTDPFSSEGINFFENRENFLDKALQALSDHVHNLEILGYNNEYSASYLREELQRRAESLTGRMHIFDKQLRDNDDALNANATSESLINIRRGYQVKLQRLYASLRLTISLMERNNIDAREFKIALIQTSGKVTKEILDREVLMGVVSGWWSSVNARLIGHGVDILINVLYFSVIMLLFYLLAKIVAYIVEWTLRSSRWNISTLMRDVVNHAVLRLILLLGVLFALGQLGVSLGPILAGLGLAGFAIAFAMQDVISNFASGVMILFYRPYDVGDYVEISGEFGKVKSMSLVSTTLVTIDNQSLIVPNSKIWGNIIKNVTAQSVRRVDMIFGVSYADDIDQVESLLEEILSNCEKVLKRPEPTIKLHQLNSSSVDFVVRPWVRTDDYWDVYWEITRAVKKRFDDEGISIPFPQQDVHLYAQTIRDNSSPSAKS